MRLRHGSSGCQLSGKTPCLCEPEPRGLGDHDNLYRHADDPDIDPDLIRNIICHLMSTWSMPETSETQRSCLLVQTTTYLGPTSTSTTTFEPRPVFAIRRTSVPGCPWQDYKLDFVHVSDSHFNIHCNSFDHLKFHDNQYYNSGKCELHLQCLAAMLSS